MNTYKGLFKGRLGIPSTKEGVAKLSIVSVSVLIIIKAVAGVLTGSISIMADAIHSVLDLLGVIIGFICIRAAGKPPDEQHAYGHGKAENIAGVVVAALIFAAAATITYEAIKRIIIGSTVELLDVGIYVTVAAIVINLSISQYALRTARSYDSPALEAVARDMFADLSSSGAVLIGLVLVRITGINMLDSIVALLVAVLIGRTAYHTMKKSLSVLMDTRLPKDEEAAIRSCIKKYANYIIDFHKLRTRKAGSQRHIDLHLVMKKDISLDEAHKLCDKIEAQIKNKLPESDITIHCEPYSK